MVSISVLIGVLFALVFEFVWYGIAFQKHYMSIIPNKQEATNKSALLAHALALLLFGANIQLLHNAENVPFYTILTLLLGSALLFTFSTKLFEYGNKRDSVKLFGIMAGGDITAMIIVVTTILVVP